MNNSPKIAPSIGQLSILFKVANFLIGHDEVKTILEFGSRYGEDTIEFAKEYPLASIYSFECNPKSLSILKEKIKSYGNIIFNEYAISDVNEKIQFYQINEEKTKTTWLDGNQGASSIFEASGNYPIEEYYQDIINVEAITLHSFLSSNRIPFIDAMWMDIQGAELKALKGMGDKLFVLKIIHLEVEFIEIYKGQPLFKNIDQFLKENDFALLGFTSKTDYSGDAVYINKRFFSHSLIQKAVLILPLEKRNLRYYFFKLFFILKYTGFRFKNLLISRFLKK